MRITVPLSLANLFSFVVDGRDCKDLEDCVMLTKKNTQTANLGVFDVVLYYLLRMCLLKMVPYCKIKLKHFAVSNA